MGLLSLGTPLQWEEAKKYAEHVRKNGIEQFISIWRQTKDSSAEPFVWGDELEYIVVKFNPKDQTAHISLDAAKSIKVLQQEEMDALANDDNSENGGTLETLWRPEYGSFMLEATPGVPYSHSIESLLQVEPNMRLRRIRANETLNDNEDALPIGNFPLFGAPGFVDSSEKPFGPVLRSLFVPDAVMYPHPRFGTLSGNIRKRRGSKVKINVPIFHDKSTPNPFIDPEVAKCSKLGLIEECDKGAALPDHIYMDAMGFGMGCCCIQMTFQAGSIQQARKLYDHLAPVGAILMALSASTPLYRGYVSDIDCRWNVISASVDCRTLQERGIEPLTTDKFVIPKSRYATIDTFLGSDDGHFDKAYNDLDLVYDERYYKQLVGNGVDEELARHIAHLFIRDPIVIFEELLNQDNTASSDHFENIQSTNWQNVRFKPPPPNSSIGWRVEFRTGEIQFTEFENAALAIFVNLLARAIVAFNLNFYIPITRMDENMERAHRRDAVNREKFYFRNNVFPKDSDSVSAANGHTNGYTNGYTNGHTTNGSAGRPNKSQFSEKSLDEIINGHDGGFVGLIPIVLRYLDTITVEPGTKSKLMEYIRLLSLRASGALVTNAAWIRKFVRSHPDYKSDSVVSPKINYDLLSAIKDIVDGQSKPPELYGTLL